MRRKAHLILPPLVVAAGPLIVAGQEAPLPETPSSSIMARAVADQVAYGPVEDGHALRITSMFALTPEAPREFALHDLVQIVVRETSRAISSHELELDKSYDIAGAIPAWPNFQLEDLLQLRIEPGRTDDPPILDIGFEKNFEGEGEYERSDDMTARLTAEVIDVLPNGNLLLEARTFIRVDNEESTIEVTGICRPEDVSGNNEIFSHQIHDLKLSKVNTGDLKETNERGIIAKVLDTIFAF